MQDWIIWLQSLEWTRLVPELIGKALGIILGLLASWFLIFRRKLKAWEKLRSGDSDDILFQMHLLQPLAGTSDQVLLFRNVSPRLTIHRLYDNEVVREEVVRLANLTSLQSPVLPTQGTIGFEILNDAYGHIAGQLAVVPFPKQIWLFTMTCEDRAIVRKKCLRCFLIRPQDLEAFTDWAWCRDRIRVEKPWHWFRVVALHQIALEWQRQQSQPGKGDSGSAQGMPLVHDQEGHDRIRPISLGLNPDDQPVEAPYRIPWQEHLPTLKQMGLPLAEGTSPAIHPSGPPAEFRRG